MSRLFALHPPRAVLGVVAMIFAALLTTSAPVVAEEAELWKALRSGEHFALLRHALAPGTGDPVEFALRDCSTQRNLSAGGREQAQRIGARFHDNGIRTARVFSSQWCRCLDTANLLGLGPVNELPDLNSFYEHFERQEPQTQAMQRWLAEQRLDAPLVLVTHQVNISALTGVYPSSGELVILRRDGGGNLEVLGTIETE